MRYCLSETAIAGLKLVWRILYRIKKRVGFSEVTGGLRRTQAELEGGVFSSAADQWGKLQLRA